MVPPFFFFPFLNWAMSSTVLLVIINLLGRYRGGEMERSKRGIKSRKLVNGVEALLRERSTFVQK